MSKFVNEIKEICKKNKKVDNKKNVKKLLWRENEQ